MRMPGFTSDEALPQTSQPPMARTACGFIGGIYGWYCCCELANVCITIPFRGRVCFDICSNVHCVGFGVPQILS